MSIRKLLFIILVISTNVACPPMPKVSPILFKSGDMISDNFKFMNESDKITLSVSGHGWFKKYAKRYELSFGIKVQTDKANEIIVYADSIKVFLNNLTMNKVHIEGEDYIYRSKKSISNGSSYYLNMDSVSTDYFLKNDNEIMIIMDNTILIDSKFVFIDTIWGIDSTSYLDKL